MPVSSTYREVHYTEAHRVLKEAESAGRTCSRGHKLTPETAWVTLNRHGNYYLRCRECKKISNRRRKPAQKAKRKRKDGSMYRGVAQLTSDAAMQIALGDEIGATLDVFVPLIVSARMRRRPTTAPPSEDEHRAMWDDCVDDIWRAVEALAKDESKKPWNYLRVKPEAEAAWDRFNKALTEANDTGENLPNCVDNPAEFCDYDEEDMPTAEEAYDKCYGCPVLELCATYAEQERPAWGIHGGDRWVMGEVVND